MISYCEGANKGTWNNDDCLEVFLFEVKQTTGEEEEEGAHTIAMHIISIIILCANGRWAVCIRQIKRTEKKM